ncbi:hypothetical protein [Catellatospora coxensis]|uniref:Uncharacterized protein n=1 Tax=Catellatospora coxensis TaxID=310354 RepID=A0A8J3P910_9ACTN|nr:hypothetical protein [Catellatospora coxensis]GIG08282.1 hypothetical protein Cco03nite_49820 [Catellatospora coxensis]
MPLAEDAVRVGLACGPDRDGRWRGWYDIRVRAGELWTLGLHPDQPSARVTGPSPPAWWHAAAEHRAGWRGPRRRGNV